MRKTGTKVTTSHRLPLTSQLKADPVPRRLPDLRRVHHLLIPLLESMGQAVAHPEAWFDGQTWANIGNSDSTC